VIAAEGDIRQLIAALRAAQPVSARGVAIAELLLTDGAGPLYLRSNEVGLAVGVRDALRYLPCPCIIG
jgi:hypothetical protein